jgi:hypothetical protein
MATVTIIVIPDRYTARGLTFLPHGQQCTMSLPPGEYDVLGTVDLCYTDFGQSKCTDACMLVNIANGQKWYVGVQIGDWLVEHYKRPS